MMGDTQEKIPKQQLHIGWFILVAKSWKKIQVPSKRMATLFMVCPTPILPPRVMVQLVKGAEGALKSIQQLHAVKRNAHQTGAKGNKNWRGGVG